MTEILRAILPSKIHEKVGRLPLLFLPLMWVIFRMLIIPLFDNKFLIISPKVKCKVRNKGWIILQKIWRDNIYGRKYKLKRDDVVTNVGIFTLKVIKTIGREGLCIAIEPESNNFKLLEETTRQYDNVIRLQVAVSNTEGYAKLYLAETSGEHSIKRNYGVGYITVKMETLDQITEKLNLKKINFIKIDVEGANKILSLFRPKLVLEYHSIGELYKIIEILENLNYNYGIFNEKYQLRYIYAWREQ